MESGVDFLWASQRPLIRSFICTSVHSTGTRYSTRLRFKVSRNVLPISSGPHDIADGPICDHLLLPFWNHLFLSLFHLFNIKKSKQPHFSFLNFSIKNKEFLLFVEFLAEKLILKVWQFPIHWNDKLHKLDLVKKKWKKKAFNDDNKCANRWTKLRIRGVNFLDMVECYWHRCMTSDGSLWTANSPNVKVCWLGQMNYNDSAWQPWF